MATSTQNNVMKARTVCRTTQRKSRSKRSNMVMRALMVFVAFGMLDLADVAGDIKSSVSLIGHCSNGLAIPQTFSLS
jgi:hypothetical protein